MKTKLPVGFLPACALLFLAQLLLPGPAINSQSPNNGPSSPPQTGLRLWLKADTGIETNGLGQITRWCDQSASQAHAVLAQGSTGPQINTSSDLGFPTIAFNGQTGALQLPSFMNGATAATAYIIVKSEKTNNPLWSMGATPAGTLYPAASGKIEDDFASTLVQGTRDATPPLHEWHAYQVTSRNGAWWPALDQTLFPTKRNMAVQSFFPWYNWPGDMYTGIPLPSDFCLWAQMPSNSIPFPAVFPETGYAIDITVQSVGPPVPNSYFGLYYLAIYSEDTAWFEDTPYYEPGSLVPPYFKKVPYVGGIARFTLTMDELEAIIGQSLYDERIIHIGFECESVILNHDDTFNDYLDFYNGFDVKINFSVDATEINNRFGFAATPSIGGGFKGEIAEILIYDQTAEANEAVNNYLSNKYGIFVVDLLKDSDGDGIPDAWEIRNGLNPLDPSDALGVGGNGSTYLQIYLDSLQTGTKSPDLELEIFSPAK